MKHRFETIDAKCVSACREFGKVRIYSVTFSFILLTVRYRKSVGSVVQFSDESESDRSVKYNFLFGDSV